MTTLDTAINTILQQLKSEIASETWESRRLYFNQMLRLADILNIIKPCQELYDAFIADINGSKERHSLHRRCVKLIDALVGTHAKDENGTLFNEDPLPTESMTLKFFQHRRYPITESVTSITLLLKLVLK